MAFLSMMKFLVTPEHPQSSTGAMGDAGFWIGCPDIQVGLAPQDSQRAPGSVGRRGGWLDVQRSPGVILVPMTHPLQANLALEQPYICMGLAPTVSCRSQRSPLLG